MLRKSTIIVLIIFIIALGLVIYNEKSPNSFFSGTPTTTSSPGLITDWSSDDVTKIQITGEDLDITIIKNDDGKWFFENSDFNVDQYKVFELLTTLDVLDLKTTLEEDTSIDTLGLDEPDYTISIVTNIGAIIKVSIGDITPTSSGYYVMVNDGTPSVVSKTSLDVLLDAFNENSLILVTPTPTFSILTTPSAP